ncbi:MAG: hypothetical protein JXA99_14880 [Candidatus Lokiarchaeota archaeon]|nr:hypothetical protein [Candidatus Lokiarchaeota archaeon]
MNLTVQFLEEMIKNSNKDGYVYAKIIKFGKEDIYNVINSTPNPIKLALIIDKNSEKKMKPSELLNLLDNYGEMSNIELIKMQSSIFISEIYDVNEGYIQDEDIFLVVKK